MNRDDIIRMAREAKIWLQDLHYGYEKIDEHLVDGLERFAALVEAHVNAKEKERQRYDIHSCGPDCDRLICVAVRKARQEERNRVWTQEHWTEYERSIAAAEREACAKVCDEMASRDTLSNYYNYAVRVIKGEI